MENTKETVNQEIQLLGSELARELKEDELEQVSGAVWVNTNVDLTTFKDSMFIN